MVLLLFPSAAGSSSLPCGQLSTEYPRLTDNYCQASVCAGHILKGEKACRSAGPAGHEIGAWCPSKTVEAIGLTIPSSILVRADEMIE
jgi:hypothetical protein